MKEIGLLFTPENRDLVRRGLKVQTRRGNGLEEMDLAARALLGGRNYWAFFEDQDGKNKLGIKKCPYGNPQSTPTRFYLKEPVQILTINDGVPGSPLPWVELIYLDDGKDATEQAVEITGEDYHKLLSRQDWRKPSSSMFMLKSFARTWLPGVRTWPERLGDMSDLDAICEGISQQQNLETGKKRYGIHELNLWSYESPKDAYRMLWDSINGPGSWKPEIWVWCIAFEPPAKPG